MFAISWDQRSGASGTRQLEGTMKASVMTGAAFSFLLATPALADRMPMDTPVTVNGISTVCTGIGDEAQHDPRWAAYPIRVEFSNGGAQYIAGGHVELKKTSGETLASVDCSGTWVLFQLPAGDYSVTATLLYHPNQPARSASFSPPATGQKRVVLEFKGVNPNE
jgi:hypothetical protein